MLNAYLPLALLGLASFAHGRTKLDVETQDVLNSADHPGYMVVTLQEEISVKRDAEIASLSIRVSTSSNHSSDVALQEADVQLSRLDALLSQHIPRQQKSYFESADTAGWRASSARVQDKDDWREDIYWDDFDETDETTFPDATNKAMIKACARFTDLQGLRTFINAIRSDKIVVITSMEFSLSEATRASAKQESRRKALRTLTSAGEDYADLFGYKRATPLEMEEIYAQESSVGSGNCGSGDKWYGGSGRRWLKELTADNDWDPKVELSTEVRSKIKLH